MRDAPRGRAVLATFSGIDGAGKSTLIAQLRSRLQQDGVRVLSLAFWDCGATLPGLREFASHALFRGERGIGSRARPVNRRDKNIRSGPMTLFRLFLYFIDALHLRARLARVAPVDVIIYDRYIYDEIANLPLSRPMVRGCARLLMRIAPRPDLACLLDVDPHLARERKPEYPLDFLHENRSSFLALSRLHGDMLVIDSPSAAHDLQTVGVLQERLYRALSGPDSSPTVCAA